MFRPTVKDPDGMPRRMPAWSLSSIRWSGRSTELWMGGPGIWATDIDSQSCELVAFDAVAEHSDARARTTYDLRH
jgi:hypothetical protein